jgi:hypothetical protein
LPRRQNVQHDGARRRDLDHRSQKKNGKVDAVSELARESAIVVSLAPQCGCSIETLRHALAGRDTGPISAALVAALALADAYDGPGQDRLGLGFLIRRASRPQS